MLEREHTPLDEKVDNALKIIDGVTFDLTADMPAPKSEWSGRIRTFLVRVGVGLFGVVLYEMSKSMLLAASAIAVVAILVAIVESTD